MADINILTAAMKVQFLNSMQAVGQPAPIEGITTEINSTARFENFPWMTPGPGISRYKGYRRYAKISSINYRLENVEYDGALTVGLRDYEDDQVGGFKLRMKDLVEKSKAPFRTRILLQFLAAGATNPCFDTSFFFDTAANHKIGGSPAAITGLTGSGNLYTVNSAAVADGTAHRVIIMIKNQMLNPLLFLNRKSPKLITDVGTPQSELAKRANWAIDLECTPGHGYWWDAVQLIISGTPTVLELINYINLLRNAISRFTLPVSLATDPLEYVHEQLDWNPDNIVVLVSNDLFTLMNQVLNETYFGISQAGSTSGITPNNIYYKKFTLIHSNYLNTP
jgi:phage major head subunit gpT-like protein